MASLSCLTASGGIANGLTSGEAEVLGVQTTLGLDPASAFRTSASFGPGAVASPILPSFAEAILPAAEAPRAVSAPAAGLPRTGVAAASLGASGLAALLSGSALRLIGRRRRRTAELTAFPDVTHHRGIDWVSEPVDAPRVAGRRRRPDSGDRRARARVPAASS